VSHTAAEKAVEKYLRDLNEIYRTGGGVEEESYYPPLANLINEVGRKLKPRVRCVGQLKNIGAGAPDFGLFTSDQFQRAKDVRPIEGQPPARGVIECKPWNDDSFARTKSSQVSKYWKRYNLVLVTNYRDFVLIGRDDAGKPMRLESYRMAQTENEFRALLSHPRKAAHERGERLVEFLSRVMLHAAALTNPEDLAWFLASYAREARARVEQKAELPALEGLKKALEEALGMKFEGEKGEHFFRATLVQTLFYGVFSSWVLWSRENWGRRDARFNWHDAAWTLHVPMIESLFGQIATPQRLKPLGVGEVLDWAGMVLNRVNRSEFFGRFEEEHAVQYFYEPFLKAYDPELRKELGVWYTPPEVVRYQVERVDRVLRDELNIADGLADEQVVVLDPCCGTGAYLVETLKRIHKTLQEQGASALTAQKLKKAAQERIFGFEILPAPFVVSHLQIGLVLRHLGAPLSPESDERAGVYLTNALTGWEPPTNPKKTLPLFPELIEERDAANKVKQEALILVILGNPPYNGYAGTALEEERDLVTAYRTTKQAPKPEGQGLNDLYVRFFRMAEHRIAEKTGKGIVCYISNYSWLEGLSHTGMRERYLEAFDTILIDNLHGDRIISEYAPDGRTSETVFSLGGQAPGIKVGTAISTLVLANGDRRTGQARVLYQDFDQARADERRLALVDSTKKVNWQKAYKTLRPSVEIGYPFKPAEVDEAYLTWPVLPDLFPVSFPGVKTSRDEFLVDIEREVLEERIACYFDAAVSHEELARRWPRVMEDGQAYRGRHVRDYLIKRGRSKGRIIRYAYRPFDVRWLYWEPDTNLLDRNRSDYVPHAFEGNFCLVTQQKPRRDWSRAQCVRPVACLDLMDRGASCFPLLLAIQDADHLFHSDSDASGENVSNGGKEYVSAIKSEPTALFYHSLCILHAPSYAQTNGGGLRQDWPRIPLPRTKTALSKSAQLGRRIAALLDTEKPVDGVSTGKIKPLLKPIAEPSKVGGGALNPDEGHLDVTAGWGHAGKGGVCMPGKGKLELKEQKHEGLKAALGEETLDVYLNDTAYWANVPTSVWEYSIGGYQVIKKWLSYREKAMLGRRLKIEEAEYVTEMARRIAALIVLQPDLDANYEAVKADTYPWPAEK